MNKAQATLLWRSMLRIRRVEEAIARHYPEQKMRCPVHLSIGQEAVAVGVCAALTNADQVVSTHRAHAHYLAKGGSLDALIAELYGKTSGCCAGRGGSMHLSDRSVGFLASTAIVGNSIPIGVGMSLAQKHQGADAVTCIFLGDGAIEEGSFYESANFAALHHLPVVFVCENNLYSVYSPLWKRQPKDRRLVELAAALGLTVYQADGNQVDSVYRVATEAIANVRQGKGAAFIELPTYRWLEHCGPYDDDGLGYRPENELAEWKIKDPLLMAAKELMLDVKDVANIELDIADEIEKAFVLADQAPFPITGSGFFGLYATELE